MLQSIHHYVKGTVAKLFLAAIALSFILFGMLYYINPNSKNPQAIVTVNGAPLTKIDLQNQVEQIKSYYKKTTGQSINPNQLPSIRQTALQMLINQKALLGMITSANFYIGQAQISEYIMALPDFQVNGVFSKETYQKFRSFYQKESLDLIDNVKTQLLIQQAISGIKDSAFVLPNEVSTTHEQLYQTRTFSYVNIPYAQFLDSAAIKPEMIKNYYQSHQKSFQVPEKLSIAYLRLSPTNIEKTITISDKAIKAYYDDNSAQSKTIKPLKEIKDKIKETLLKNAVNDKLSNLSDQLAKLTYSNPQTLEPAAKALGLTIEKSPLFSRNEIKKSNDLLLQEPNVIQNIFSEDVLKDNNNSDLISLKDGSVIVLRINEKQPGYIPKMEAVSQTIKEKLKQSLAKTKAILLATQLQKKVDSEKTFKLIAKEKNLLIKESKDVSRFDEKLPSPLIEAAFKLSLAKGKQSTTFILPSGDTGFIYLTAIKKPNAATNNSPKTDTKNQLLQYWQGKEAEFYVNQARKKATIQFNQP